MLTFISVNMKCYWTVNSSYWPPLRVSQYEVNTSWPPQQVNSFTILKTKNQFILLCWKKNYGVYAPTFGSTLTMANFPAGWPFSVPKFTNTSITVKHLLIKKKGGARWLSGRVSDSGARGRGFDTYHRRVVSLSKTLYSPKVLVIYPGSGGSVPTWLKNCWLGR